MTAPILRFKDQGRSYPDWVQKKLKDCVTFSKGGSLSKSDLSPHGATPCLLYGELYTTYGEVTKAVINKTDSTEDLVKSQMNDVILPMSGETAEDIAKATCIKQEGVAYGGDLMVLRSKSLDGCFLSYSLNSINRRQISRIAQGKTVVHINPSRVSDISINVACLEEQQKIASFFSTLDEKIIIINNQIRALKNVKSSFSNKLFNNELRFLGDDGKIFPNWVNTTLGELANISSASRVHRDQWQSSGIPFFRSSDVVAAFNRKSNNMGKAFISKDLYEKLVEKSGKLNPGDILVTGGGSVGIPYIVKEEEIYSKDADLIWIQKRPDASSYTPDFVYQYFLSRTFSKYLQSISHEGTIAHYTIKQAKDTPIALPCLEEQNKILQILTLLDKHIDIKHEKLQKTKRLKEALMRKMFV